MVPAALAVFQLEEFGYFAPVADGQKPPQMKPDRNIQPSRVGRSSKKEK